MITYHESHVHCMGVWFCCCTHRLCSGWVLGTVTLHEQYYGLKFGWPFQKWQGGSKFEEQMVDVTKSPITFWRLIKTIVYHQAYICHSQWGKRRVQLTHDPWQGVVLDLRDSALFHYRFHCMYILIRAIFAIARLLWVWCLITAWHCCGNMSHGCYI